MSDKMAYALFAIPQSILRDSWVKSKILARKAWNEVLENLGHLLYHNNLILGKKA